HSVPAEFQVVGEPGPDHVKMGVVQARDDGPALEVDQLGLGPFLGEDLLVAPHVRKPSVLDRHGGGGGALGIERRDLSVGEDDIAHGSSLLIDDRKTSSDMPCVSGPSTIVTPKPSTKIPDPLSVRARPAGASPCRRSPG